MLNHRPGLVCLLAFVFASANGWSDESRNRGRTVIPLWPGEVPGAPESPGEDDVPELIITPAEVRTTESESTEARSPSVGVVILPGGGYRGRAIDHEGYQIADWLAAQGIASAICTYRVRGEGNDGEGYGHPYPMMDAQRALQTFRGRAREWNVDPGRIGVIGFSAGGHLASTVSNHFAKPDAVTTDPLAAVSSRPDFAILGYPVISLGESFSHAGSQRNLLGANPEPEQVESLSNEKRVGPRTPPTFLFHTVEDTVVPVENSLVHFQACVDAGVPAALHVFPEGRHGIGLGGDVDGAAQWPSLCEAWLERVTKRN